jgi:hypothetical protein
MLLTVYKYRYVKMYRAMLLTVYKYRYVIMYRATVYKYRYVIMYRAMLLTVYKYRYVIFCLDLAWLTENSFIFTNQIFSDGDFCRQG